MAALAGVLLWQVSSLLSAAQLVRRTDAVIAQAHRLEKLLVDMETGERGYLITGDQRFLEPYKLGASAIGPAFDEVQFRVSDKPAQLRRLEELRAQGAQWEAYALEVLTLRDSGGDYRAYVSLGEGKKRMDGLRAGIASFVEVEEGVRDGLVRAAESTTRLVIALSVILTLLLGGLLAFFARRQLLEVSRSYDRALTDARRHSEALSKSEERYRLLFESNPLPMWVYDTETLSFVSVNEAAIRHYGYAREEFLRMTIKDIRPAEDVPRLMEALTQNASGLDDAGVWRHQKKDGTVSEVEITSHTLEFAGRAAELVLANDVTERRRVARELAGQQLFLRQVIDLDPNFIFAKDREGHFTLVNESLAEAYGTTVENLTGKSDADFNPNIEEVRHFRRADLDVMDTRREKFIAQESVTDSEGRIRWLQTFKRPIVSADGVALQVLGVSTDITARKRAEDELLRLNEDLEQRVAERTKQLEEANKELEAFSYSVSHDLRAPLRAINGFSRILIEDYAPQMPEGAARYLEIVRSNAKQMGQLVDDLLAFSKLGRQPLRKQSVEPAAVARQVLDELQGEHEGRSVHLSVGVMPTAQADPALLKQVYANLLSNAIKYTRGRDEARVEAGWVTRDDAPAYYVRDNGVGFDMQYANKLFGVFQRLHRTEEFEGTGVGLAIVQRIVQRHGGRVWAEAEEGKGATFYFTLPGDSTHD
jgi:PAS domain S-box-containing protein